MYTRLRSRGGLTAEPSVNTQFYYNAPNTVSTSPGQEFGVVETMEDVCTPEFRKLSSAGKFVNSPMLQTRLAVTSLPRESSWVLRKKPGQTWYPQDTGKNIGFSISNPLHTRFGVCKFPFHEVPPWNETLAGIALANARSKAADSSAALLVTLGEARETLGLIGNMLDLLRGHATPFFKLQRRFHRGELRPADFLREMSETWLLYRYGLMPLFYELEGYVKALSGDAEKKRETSRGKHADSGQKNWVDQSKTSSLIKNIKVEWSMNWTDTYRATCVYEFLDDLQSRLGMRWADVPLAAHELTRLSFVADWFVNIGEFLSSITLAARANVLLQCVSRRFNGEVLVFYSENGSTEQPTTYSECLSNGTGAQVLFSYTRKERRPYQNDNVGSLSPRVALNAKRLADAAALLATAFDVKGLRARNVRI